MLSAGKVLHFKSKKRIHLSGYTEDQVYSKIEDWWNRARTQQIKLYNGIDAILTFFNNELIMKCTMSGIDTYTYNTVSAMRTKNAFVVHVNTYKPSLLLQSIWNVIITYEYLNNNALKITYDKKISSSAPPYLDTLILGLTEEQQRADTEIVAKIEAKNMIALFKEVDPLFEEIHTATKKNY